MTDSNIEELFTPSAPCAKRQQLWRRYEEDLESVINNRASVKRKRAAALPMVEIFCDRCPIVDMCYQTAINGKGRSEKTLFTGIAGGALFHEGEPVMQLLSEPIQRSA